MKKKYNIGEITFHTKLEAEKYTRNKIIQTGIKNNVKDKFFMDLIKNYYDYDSIKSNIDSVNIEPNPFRNKYYHLSINLTDGKKVDISWRKCARQDKPSSDNNNLTRALRMAIYDEIIEFKKENSKNMICQFCKSTEDIEVDHIIEFKNIMNNFLKDIKHRKDINIPCDFDYHEYYKSPIFKESDNKFMKIWQVYHYRNSELRFLCKKCNLSRNKIMINP